MANQPLTQEYVRSLFHYGPETGILTWKVRPREHFATKSAWCSVNARFAGKIAGFDHFGYVRVLIDGNAYYAHRVIWLLVYGRWPENVDHIDGMGSNNRLANLREVDHSENMKNMRRSKLNTSGTTGVSFHKASGKWTAYITKDRKRRYIGYFHSLDEAIAARKSAAETLGFHANHGN